MVGGAPCLTMDAASDVSSGSGADSTADDQAVCRDYLRNVCRRGRRCKFPHPAGADDELAVAPVRPELVTFCHDFQNGQCARPSCRFVHCERGDEELFRRTGELPTQVLEAAVKRGADIRVGRHEVPVCKDFARGECARGAKCKYRHLTLAERPPTGAESCEPPEAKRRHFDDYSHRGVVVRDYRQAPLSREPNPHSIIDYRLIEDENRILQRRIQELQKQVDDLTTTNEFLLDQNAQMRLAKQAGGGVTSLATVTVPAVSMASSMTNGGVPTAPLTMCPISQPMVAQGAAPQVVTVPCSMGAGPVTLTHTPGSTAAIGVSLAPVTIHQQGAVVSMASMASINQAAVASMANMNPMAAASMASINQPVAVSMASMASINQAAVASMANMNPMAAASMASINQPVAASMASMASINQAAAASMASMNNMAAASMASINQPGAASLTSMNPMAAASMASINQPVAVASMASINTAAAAAAAQVNAQVACSLSGGPIVSYPIVSQLRPILSSNLQTQ
ncbi:zinc finger CCCH domain-containing protein 10-like [Pollicipes pollicipes]|uniref:zinc finger CCCH domain-containing protein 10-like n=1 Tax=Pollicipes pollicipes TaxID=41117 RepID=UPI0018849AAA|nr:zinc finger CCCH domain-containing protein 10-like [Pollicipes pollicipes]